MEPTGKKRGDLGRFAAPALQNALQSRFNPVLYKAATAYLRPALARASSDRNALLL